MANGNTVTVVGNLTRDPELRYTPSGASNTRFGAAVNRRWIGPNTNTWPPRTRVLAPTALRGGGGDVGGGGDSGGGGGGGRGGGGRGGESPRAAPTGGGHDEVPF